MTLHPFEMRAQLEVARLRAEEEYLRQLYDKAFQEGVERGRVDARFDKGELLRRLEDKLRNIEGTANDYCAARAYEALLIIKELS